MPDSLEGRALEMQPSITIGPRPQPPEPPEPPTPVPQPHLADGMLVKEQKDPAVYLVCGGAKVHIPSPAELAALGYSWNQVQVLPDGSLLRVPVIPRDGTFLRERTGSPTYQMAGGARLPVPSPDELAGLGISPSQVAVLPVGSTATWAAVPRDGILVRERSSQQAFMLVDGVLVPVPAALGHVQVVANGALAGLPGRKPLILDTDFETPPHSGATSPTWAADVVGRQVWMKNDPPPREWTQVLDPTGDYDLHLTGASGTVVMPQNSLSDNPLTHPFGGDWECWIAVDPGYELLLAPSNAGGGPEGPDYQAAVERARHMGLVPPATALHAGTLGVEFEQMFIPGFYRPKEGDRAVVIGRWIVDAGHEDFHTEIHPPLLLARAYKLNATTSTSTLISRPYLMGQTFSEGSLRAHLIAELEKAASVVGSQRIEVHPPILPAPFSGHHQVTYFVRTPELTPPPGKSASDLSVRYHFTARHGVQIQLGAGDPGTVSVTITLDSGTYSPQPAPPRHDVDLGTSDLLGQAGISGTVASVLMGLAEMFLGPIAWHLNWVISRGILMDGYTLPMNWRPPEALPTTSVPVSSLGSGPVQVTYDDSQPFPVVGVVEVSWGLQPAQPVGAPSGVVKKLVWTGHFSGGATGQFLVYSPASANWWLGSVKDQVLNWQFAGNTSNFGQVGDGRPIWTGSFSSHQRTDVLFYYPGDHNWWLGTFYGPQVQWSLAGNTGNFGQVADGRPFWTADFTGDGLTDVLFYYPGDHNWWLGTFSGGQLHWTLAGNTTGFGQVADGRPFWMADFTGNGKSQLLFYSPGDHSWWLGTFSGTSLQWSLAGNTAGFGQLADGRPFWTGDFNGDHKTEILFYSPGDHNWWLGTFSGNQLQWALAGNTAGFGQVADGRPFWTGDFNGDGKTDILFYYPGDRNWWLGTIRGAQLQWSLAGNTAGFGQVADGRPFWIGDFEVPGQTAIGFYLPGDGNWWLAQYAAGRLNWYLAGNVQA